MAHDKKRSCSGGNSLEKSLRSLYIYKGGRGYWCARTSLNRHTWNAPQATLKNKLYAIRKQYAVVSTRVDTNRKISWAPQMTAPLYTFLSNMQTLILAEKSDLRHLWLSCWHESQLLYDTFIYVQWTLTDYILILPSIEIFIMIPPVAPATDIGLWSYYLSRTKWFLSCEQHSFTLSISCGI